MRLWPLCHILQGATWSCAYGGQNERAIAVRTSTVFSGRSCSSWGSYSSFQPKAVVRGLVVWWLALCTSRRGLVRCGSRQHLHAAIARAAARVRRVSNVLLGPIQSSQWVAGVGNAFTDTWGCPCRLIRAAETCTIAAQTGVWLRLRYIAGRALLIIPSHSCCACNCIARNRCGRRLKLVGCLV